MRKWIKTLIENGGDTSRLDESWLQKGNAMFGQNFRSARQLMEEVLNAGNGRQQIAQLNELKNRRKRSDEALIDQGGDLSTDDSRKKAYKVHDEALTEARKSRWRLWMFSMRRKTTSKRQHGHYLTDARLMRLRNAEMKRSKETRKPSKRML